MKLAHWKTGKTAAVVAVLVGISVPVAPYGLWGGRPLKPAGDPGPPKGAAANTLI